MKALAADDPRVIGEYQLRAHALTGIGWLIGLGAVAFLGQRPSGAFFNARAPISR